jgi:HAD superfamily hydrolase (TIGR01549 family)
MKIKAVILDFGGTLVEGGIDFDRYHEALLTYFMSIGYRVTRKEIDSAMKVALGNLNRIRARGREQTFEEVYSLFLKKINIFAGEEILIDLHKIFKKYFSSNFFLCSEDVLKELSKKYKVALLSNTMSDKPLEMLRDANLIQYFDLVVCSRDLGIRKPNPEIFKYVLEKLGVSAEESVHVGDSVKADMEGASGVGITGIWIKLPNEIPWYGYAITTICDLPNLLKKIAKS